MRIFDKEYAVSRIDHGTFQLQNGKEIIKVYKSPANDGTWNPRGKWLAVSFHLNQAGNLQLGRPKL